MVSLNDLADGQVIELGRHSIVHISTPHVPHGWEARVLFDQATRTLLCGDVFTHFGNGPATTSDDIVTLAAFAEDAFGATCLTPHTAPTIRKTRRPRANHTRADARLIIHRNSSQALRDLATEYETRLNNAA